MGRLTSKTFGQNPLGIHWIVLEKEWTEEGARRAAGKARALGYDFIEIPPIAPGSDLARATRQALEAAGLGATVSLGLSAEQDLTSDDPRCREAGEVFLAGLIDLCGEVGASAINGINYSAFQKYAAPCTPAGRAASIEAMARLGEKAGKVDVTIGLEVVNRYETNVLNTAAQAVAFARETGSAAIRVHLDSYHMNIEEPDVEGAIVATGELLEFFHVGESHRGYLGTGNVDFVSIFRGLAKAGYRGPISFESFSSAMIGQPLLGILAIWRDTWEDGEDLAAHALDFMRSYLKSAREGR